MAKTKEPPLTGAQIEIAQIYNRWYHTRKEFLPKEDLPPGDEFTNKNYGDLVDQFLQQAPAIKLEVGELVHIVRRYRSRKGAESRRKTTRKKLRKMLARRREVKCLLKAKRREAKRAKKAEEESLKREKREEFARAKEEIKSRQGILTGFIFQ